MIFVVAEIGVNWDGDFELAKEMMQHAKKTGCNAVKFQAYLQSTVKDHPESSRLMKTTITETNVGQINELAQKVGIEWFCTPFYPEAVDFLEPFVKRYKIRVADGKPLLENSTSKLLDRVFETKKEVIVSSQTSPNQTKFFHHPNLKWLYCVPKYPCMLNDLDFSRLRDFDGFSNHHPHFIAPLSAAIMGAKIIEVHITSDKSKNFIDNNVSFNYEELQQLVELIRSSEKIIK